MLHAYDPTVRRPTFREARIGDVDLIVTCFERAFGDDRRVDRAEVESWLSSSDVAEDSTCVVQVEGRVVGYADVVHVAKNDELELCIAAHGYESFLLDWAESLARRRQIGGTRAYIPVGHQLEPHLAARGYRYWCSSLTMHMEFGANPPRTPPPPDGIALTRFDPDAGRTVLELLNEVFADDPFFRPLTDTSFAERFTGRHSFDPDHWHLAWAGDVLVGVALAYPERSGDPRLGFVDSLGVRQEWRRRGIGEALLRSAFASLQSAGLGAVELGVVADNPNGAVRLYERAGMTTVIRWDNWRRRFNV